MPPMTPGSYPLPVLGSAREHDTHDAHEHHAHDHGHSHGPELPASPPAPGEHGYNKTYWRGIEEQLGGPGFRELLAREFPPGADEPPDEVGRRDFLQLIGASLALAGLTGCPSRPEQKILPYTRTPVDVSPGTPLHFATAASLGGYATGLLVTSWEGRPTKIEGNPDHPWTRGITGTFEQALLLQLYDPNRARLIKQRGTGQAWRTFLAAMDARALELAQKQGEGLYLLLEPTASPLLGDLRRRIIERFPRAKLFSYTAASDENVYEGARLAFGQPLRPNYDFSKADVVLSLDADFLHPTPDSLRYALAFADRRDPKRGKLNRLYVVEPRLSITGAMSDHRLRMRASELLAFGHVLRERLLARNPGFDGPLTEELVSSPERRRWLKAVTADLLANQGRCLIVAGERQPPELHALAYQLNEALGSFGQTLQWTTPVLHDTRTGVGSLRDLAIDIDRGKVDTLLITASNPVYSAPVDLGLKERLAKVPHTVYHGLYEDESAACCAWFIPATHSLESWGDARSADGTTTLVQPLISPLFNGVSEADLLASLLGEAGKGTYALLQDYWRPRAGAGMFATTWETWLAQGWIPSTALRPVTPPPVSPTAIDRSLDLARLVAQPGLEVSFVPDYTVHDGRFANNPWLQELPDPITKISWDNAALISPATANRLGLSNGQVVTLTFKRKTVDAPIWIVPGYADDSITLPIGYGRMGTEEVARGVGFNANALRQMEAPWFGVGLEVGKPHGKQRVPTTQWHWWMEGRPLALDVTDEQLAKEPNLTQHLREPPNTLHEPPKYEGHKWGMAVDLSRCIGCNACTVACQSENNIPVVGKEQVLRGREMHWLRIDRYFEGTPEDPRVIHQPMACVHCENAPCEYVCPVNATVHSDEGLNEMVYNRCIGTRFCSNNCPYKVRRFNFLHYNHDKSPLHQMAMNPEVTVRARGIMEKCTYCVQRIERVRIDARNQGRNIREGEIKTACQQACPTQAIVFGDLANPESHVSQLHAEQRSYYVLNELGTHPRTAYLVRVRNPNPELA